MHRLVAGQMQIYQAQLVSINMIAQIVQRYLKWGRVTRGSLSLTKMVVNLGQYSRVEFIDTR